MRKIICILCIIIMLALVMGCQPELIPETDSLVGPMAEPEDEVGAEEGELLGQEEISYVSLYFLSPTGDYLFPLSFSYDSQATTEDMVRILQDGPIRREWGESPVPANLAIESIHMVGQRAQVHVNPGRLEEFLPGEEEMLVKALVYSLTSLKDVSRVEFLQEGKKPEAPFQLLAEENLYASVDLVLNPLEEMDADSSSARLWFTNQDVLYMVPVSLPLETVPEDPHELSLLLIDALLAGPGYSLGLLSPFPEDTRVLSLRVQDETIYVDFNRALKANFTGGSSQEWALLNSLVLTLTEIPGINQVQILVEGRKEEAVLGHMDTTEPLIRGVVNWVLTD